MYNIRVDVQKNRVFLTVRGDLSLDDVNQMAPQLLEEVKKLRRGFGMISDALDTMPITGEVSKQLQRLMRKMIDGGMGHIVRINSNPLISRHWLGDGHDMCQPVSNPVILDEAEKLLDKMEADQS